MRTEEMTCIVCPMGCRLTVTENEGTVTVKGNTCKRGEAYGKQEFTMPMRTVTTSVAITGADRPVLSVKTQQQVPKAQIPQVLAEIRKAKVQAPVKIGDVVIANVANTGVAVVATSASVAK